MAETLEQVLADERGDAATLRAKGFTREADMIERILDRVSAASEDYLRFLDEKDASIWSGKSESWLRAHHAAWEQLGHAKRDRGRRWYRAVVLPRRADLDAARAAGRRGEVPQRKVANG